MQATEGNGGPGIVLTRDPVERPDYRRGEYLVPGRFAPSDEDRITFTREVDGFDVTFHDCQVTSSGHGSISVFVSPHDVVTWAKRG